MPHPTDGDTLLRDAASGYVVVDAMTLQPLAGPYPTIAEAALTARRTMVWVRVMSGAITWTVAGVGLASRSCSNSNPQQSRRRWRGGCPRCCSFISANCIVDTRRCIIEEWVRSRCGIPFQRLVSHGRIARVVNSHDA